MSSYFDELTKESERLGEVIWNPAQWPNVMEAICRGARSSGAPILPPAIDTKDLRWTHPSIRSSRGLGSLGLSWGRGVLNSDELLTAGKGLGGDARVAA
jgi:hypothetical protein